MFHPTEEMEGDTVPDPVVVVEVVSRFTRLIDEFDKNVDYAATPSIVHYLMVSEERRAATVCSRTNEGWVSVEFEGDGSISLPALRVELALDEIYRGITFGRDPA